jgi:DNA polymerase-3 subunit delta'
VSLLPWQRDLAQRIGSLVADAQLPHGVLITGMEGWGEIAFAQWLALTLLTESLDLNASEIAHPDLRWVKPDGAEIKVDAIREIGRFAFTTSQRGGRKVVVLESAHLLNRNAANALLKTLEEPPDNTFVLLASCHPSRLLPTIRSRCQRFVIRPDVASAREWLTDQWAMADVDARLEANAGAPLLVAAELAEGTAPFAHALDAIGATAQPLECLNDLLARDPGQLTSSWYRHIRGMLAQAPAQGPAAGVPQRRLFEFADELLWVRYQLLNTNSANARLLLGRLIVKWHGLGT